MTRSIFLIGFMGSGKSYWGQRLAEVLHVPFVDLDADIVASTGKSIAEIFAEQGESGFRALERQHLQVLISASPTVVATGGGTPCFFDNMDQMNAHACTIFLDVPVEVLAKRLSSEMQKRPMLAGLEPEQLPEFIEQMLEKRLPYYKLAQHKPAWSGVEAEYLSRLLLAANGKNS
ncbi:MAG: shikimate kinase [Saprospiraceae bacterium]|nr:shikimate kinase [Saprospiraceae bacterium]